MYRIEALPSDLAASFVGASKTVVVSDAQRSGPCRHCLRDSLDGEQLALVSYAPFQGDSAYRESGPIFVHAGGCERFCGEVLPANYEPRKLVLRAYDEREWIVDAKVAEPGEFDTVARELFTQPHVREIHVRHLAYGCYAFRLARKPPDQKVTRRRVVATMVAHR
jgi:hypothetical protein